MPFMHPGILWWGGAVATVPIIIHLLNRRRFKILDWAAMRFLLESSRKNRRRVRLEELILLALRCLAVMLLTLAVGRFMGCTPGQILPVGTPAQTAHVFVLDDSASMGQRLADTTAFAKAAADLADMIGKVRSTDRVAVLLTSRPGRAEAVFNLNNVTEPEALAGRLRSLKPSDTVTQLHQALHTAGEILDDVSSDKRVVVLSDFRRADYVSAANLEEVRRELRALAGRKAELVLMAYAPPPAGNLTLERVEMLDKLAVAGVPVRVQATVRNNGPERAENVTVEFQARGKDGVEFKLPSRSIKSVDPGQTQLVQAECALADPGSAVVEVRLRGDALAADNVARLALEVREARQALIVDGDQDVTNPLRNESFYLAVALDPTGDQRYGNRVEVVPAERVGEVSFEKYDVVILANVGDFPQGVVGENRSGFPQLEALKAYVNKGGGLAIFVGSRVNPTFYNGPFYEGGTGLLPARLGSVVGDARGRETYVRLKRDSIAPDAVIRSFQGRRAQFTQLVRFYAFLPVEEMAGAAPGSSLAPARVLARFDNTGGNVPNSPAILSRLYGNGTVMLICSSADQDWSDWPKDFTFITFVNDMMETISRSAGRDFTAAVGQPIDYVGGAEMASARASLQTPAYPAEDVVPLESKLVAGQRQVTYDRTRYAGVYELKLSGGDSERSILFARNVDGIEGRLEAATESELSGQLGVKFAYENRLDPAALTGNARAGTRQEYWKAALVAMLIVLALEVFLGQRFGHYSAARK